MMGTVKLVKREDLTIQGRNGDMYVNEILGFHFACIDSRRNNSQAYYGEGNTHVAPEPWIIPIHGCIAFD